MNTFDIAVFLGLIAVVWGGWCWIEERRCRRELEQDAADVVQEFFLKMTEGALRFPPK